VTTLFGNNSNPAPQDHAGADDDIDYVAALTKDGKEPDIKELAKGKYHADQHIAKIEREQEELRKELEKRLSWEELASKLDKITAKPTEVTSHQPSNAPNMARESNNENDKATIRDGLTPQQIEELVRQTVTKEESRKASAVNIQAVKQTLQKTLGANYESVLLQKVSQLGLDKQYVEEIAAKSPAAFYALIGVQPDNAPNPTGGLPPRSSSNVVGKQSTKNEAYYENIRKTDPKTYFSPKIQNEMFQMAKQMGADFYK
jgi:hypothetical protein